eukprot:TRINITY_DN2630_c0_g1_i1.p1 TRINITY_DN2630_c0_g1~~TRINITY_DN2630_c0_g1_i1.p1  ORF type:complete len:339 (-),score=33.99 TRINITY_DN2630_c0_g1_i1:53-967(-)
MTEVQQRSASVSPSLKTLPAPTLVPTPVAAPAQCIVCCETAEVVPLFPCHKQHPVCAPCLRRVIYEESTSVRAPNISCISCRTLQPLEPQKIRALLFPPELDQEWTRLEDRVFQHYLATTKGVRWCPGCATPWILDTECLAGKEAASAACESCCARFCLRCPYKAHDGLTCAEAEADRSLRPGSALSWISKYTKDCPRCATPIFKDGGCNSMICQACGHEFCWMCFVPTTQGSHPSCYRDMTREQQQLDQDRRAERQSLERVEKSLRVAALRAQQMRVSQWRTANRARQAHEPAPDIDLSQVWS